MTNTHFTAWVYCLGVVTVSAHTFTDRESPQVDSPEPTQKWSKAVTNHFLLIFQWPFCAK